MCFDQARTRLGIVGLGALIAPLVATQFSHMHHWSYHYLTSLGISLIDVVLLITIFRFKTQDREPMPTSLSLRPSGSDSYLSYRVPLGSRAGTDGARECELSR